MSFRTFVLQNAFRNKRRTFLTVLSIGFSLFLLVALQTILDTLMNPLETEESALRLAVRRSTSLADQMPMAYRSKIERIPNVKYVMPMQWVGAQYKEPKNFFANFAVDQEVLFDVFPEYEPSPGAVEAFKSEKTGAIAGVYLMEKFGWEIGDRITLTGTIFPVDLEFKIVGTYASGVNDQAFYFRYDYLDDSLENPGSIGAFWVMAENAEAIPGIMDAIDATFRNTPAETKTETEKAFQLGFVSMLGNVQFLIGSIASVVVFTMLLVAGSTMAMTIRERMREVAILKSMGYTRGIILALILGEAGFVAFLGGVVGCLAAVAVSFVDLTPLTMGFVPVIDPGNAMIGAALGVSVLIGVLAGLLPALQASGMTISTAMRLLD